MDDRKFKFENGEAYEQMMGVWSQLVGFKFLQWLSPSIEQRWIDVGCGNGAFTEQIVKIANLARSKALIGRLPRLIALKTGQEFRQQPFK